jgi:tRNA threonylcarbamoyladenosine biosynthesis protein TsaB
MKALALDTTTREGSVALVDGDRVVAEHAGDGTRTHALRLPGELIQLADAQHLALSDVDLFAVASGPGSFTGLRIGIATIQGLAFVHGRKVVGVPALDALAHLAALGAAPGSWVAAWMDGHRREVFAGLYKVTAAELFALDRVVEIEGATVGDPASTMARWSDAISGAPIVFVGDGAVMYADVIVGAQPQARVLAPPLLAGAIGRLALARARLGEAVDPVGLHPLYVRRPDAELARDLARRGEGA